MIDSYYQLHTIPFFLLEFYTHLHLFPPLLHPFLSSQCCHSSTPVSCSSLLLHATAHKHDIPTHFLNGPPVLLRLCQFSSARSPSSFPHLTLKLRGSQPSVSIYLPLLSLNHQSEGPAWDTQRHTGKKRRVDCVNKLLTFSCLSKIRACFVQ